MSEALYRKYRPQTFEDVVGQEHIERTIKNAIEQAADVASGTVLRHRADIRLDFERAQSIAALLDDKLAQAECLADVVRATQAFKALVDARAKLIDKEREAFGIESGDKGGDDKDLNIEVKFV